MTERIEGTQSSQLYVKKEENIVNDYSSDSFSDINEKEEIKVVKMTMNMNNRLSLITPSETSSNY